MKLTVMSYNVQHFLNFKTRKIDYDLFANTIKKYQADIIGLNEIFGQGYDDNINNSQIEEVAKKLGYYFYFGVSTTVRGFKYGNAILSKYPIISAKVIKIPNPIIKKGKNMYERRSILKVKIDIGKRLNIIISHFGLNFDEQNNATNKIINFIDENNTILMGDLNMMPDNTNIFKIKEKLFDTAEYLKKDYKSFPSIKPREKIDYIFVSHDIKILSAAIPQIVTSDHCPYISQIEV